MCYCLTPGIKALTETVTFKCLYQSPKQVVDHYFGLLSIVDDTTTIFDAERKYLMSPFPSIKRNHNNTVNARRETLDGNNNHTNSRREHRAIKVFILL